MRYFLGPLFAQKMALAAFAQPALLLILLEAGMGKWLYIRLAGAGASTTAGGRYRMNFDLEFATVITWVEIALLYGYALPLILPLASAALGTHWLVYSWLLHHGKASTYPCASPSAGYLMFPLMLQAAYMTWFFVATAVAPGYNLPMAAVVWVVVLVAVGCSCAKHHTELITRWGSSGSAHMGHVDTSGPLHLTEVSSTSQESRQMFADASGNPRSSGSYTTGGLGMTELSLISQHGSQTMNSNTSSEVYLPDGIGDDSDAPYQMLEGDRLG